MPYNLTYQEHYQIAIYVDCKPCPPRYKVTIAPIPISLSYTHLSTLITQLYLNIILEYTNLTELFSVQSVSHCCNQPVQLFA